MHSENYEKIKHYYDIGLYKEKHLNKLLSLGFITREEYQEITEEGEDNGS